MNLCFTTVVFPEKLKIAHIKAVFKKGKEIKSLGKYYIKD